MQALYAILMLLAAASFAAVMVPWSSWRGMADRFRRLPRGEACLLLAVFAAATWCAGTKPPAPRSRRVAQLLTVMQDGGLRGPTNVIASAVAAAAVQAVLAEASAMLSSASNAVQWCWAEIPDLEFAITNTTVAYLQCEIPAPLTTPNPVARADMLQVAEGTNGIKHVLVSFSVVPTTAPIIQFWADDDLCASVSNSFPATVPVETPSGTATCYVYTVQVPAAMTGVVMLPEREIKFGGGPSNAPLSVLGSLMVNDRLGFTGSRPIAPGVVGAFEGGALVEVYDE